MRGNEADDRKLWAADANWTLKRHLNGNEIFSQDLGGNEGIGGRVLVWEENKKIRERFWFGRKMRRLD